MNIFWVSICLAWLQGAFGVWLEQTPSTATKEAGESLTINCVLKGTSYPLLNTFWFRQSPGKSTKENLSDGGRYIESVNRGAKSFSLQIRNLIPEDSATYICQATVKSRLLGTRDDYDGGGTVLTVKSVLATPPVISLFHDSIDVQKAKGFVELICLISNYQPKNIRVSWERSGQSIQSGFTVTSPAESSDGTFTSTSVLKVPLKEWTKGSVHTCQVSHSATNSNIRKDIRSKSGLAVFLRDPSFEEIWINKTATLVCEVISTSPNEVEISWTVGAKERVDGVRIERATKTGNQYLSIGRLSSSVAEWISGVEYTCSVRENQSATPISKRTAKTKAKAVKPKLRLLPPSSTEIQSSATATLTCLIREFNPDVVNISWVKDGATIHSNVTTFPTALQQDRTFSTSSLLHLTAAEWRKGATYSCVASHPPSQYTVKANISIGKGDCQTVDIVVTIQRPSFEEIWTRQTATIVCEVVYADLQNVNVSWRVNGDQRMEGVETRGPEWKGSKSAIVSELKVSVEEWRRGSEYMCFVEDSELPTPVKASTKISKVTEMQRPNVYLLHPSSEEMEAEKTATLICLATGFYPADIYVAWMANDTLLDSGYSIHPGTDQENGYNSVASKLRVNAEDWEKGTTFHCLVGHPSLKTNLVRSINKSHGKPTLVNMTLVLTDSFKSCI